MIKLPKYLRHKTDVRHMCVDRGDSWYTEIYRLLYVSNDPTYLKIDAPKTFL